MIKSCHKKISLLISKYLLDFLTIALFAGLYFLPLVTGLFAGVAPALKFEAWHSLWNDPQTLAALWRTLISAVLSCCAALFAALWLTKRCYQSSLWARLIGKLPAMLALPHVAFAVGLGFLIAPSGWLIRIFAALFAAPDYPPEWSLVNDSWGLSLALALALKEIPFLLWNLSALLSDASYQKQVNAARCLGYSSNSIWRSILRPQLLKALFWPLIAVLAYSLNVVDVAQVIGPSSPPTLAVLVWQWLAEGSRYHAQAHAGALLLALLTGLLILLIYLGFSVWSRAKRLPNNQRGKASSAWIAKIGVAKLFAIYLLVCLSLALWSVTGAWAFPALLPQTFDGFAWYDVGLLEAFCNTMLLGIVSSALALLLGLLWLEWGSARLPLSLIIYLPLSLPPLILVAGQYQLVFSLRAEGSWFAVSIAHLTLVLPYFLLILAPAYKNFDNRYMAVARSLGCNRLIACLRVKWPILLRPIAAAVAIAFSVSVAQYLPTLFIGAGRLPTLTTEAVALSSGGSRQLLAANAMLLTLLPLLGFVLAQFIAKPRFKKHLR